MSLAWGYRDKPCDRRRDPRERCASFHERGAGLTRVAAAATAVLDGPALLDDSDSPIIMRKARGFRLRSGSEASAEEDGNRAPVSVRRRHRDRGAAARIPTRDAEAEPATRRLEPIGGASHLDCGRDRVSASDH